MSDSKFFSIKFEFVILCSFI